MEISNNASAFPVIESEHLILGKMASADAEFYWIFGLMLM